jgi:ABC-2 type transport system permease protein
MEVNMKRFLKIYFTFTSQYIKRLVHYRLDFAIGVLSFVFVQFSGILLITLVFQQIPDLNGYTFEQMVFFYGFFQLPRGLDHLITDNIWLIPMKIRKGDLDRHLLRPIDPLFQIVAERFQHEAFGELIIGGLLISITFPSLGIQPSIFTLLLIGVLILIGALIYTSIKLLTASISFWTMNSMQVMVTVYNISDFAKYPITIFPTLIQTLITYIVPFAFVSFFPASVLLNQANGLSILAQSSLALVIIASLALYVWNKGLKGYESTGH